ncbi:MAG: JAB domain-containing protein [Bacteroidetes bacterium]|nr:JAB domain-containing protein [Bacteroidota bacterium]
MKNVLQQDLNTIAEIELVYKTNVFPSKRPVIKTSQSAYELLLSGWDRDKIEFVEQFKVLLLNRANKVLGISLISTGSATGTVADPKLIFVAALKANACGIILAHNHPSGNTKPSKADELLTAKITSGATYLDINVMDHIVVTTEGYYSFADEGMM